ncbi:MAG: type IV secretion system DNA-binding domain-containing protein [Candidatus Buchananbacteria bacterium]|nr:type IV secretion system DNA-binding domain-containing protein [Candidatus Buchananbacteria bacterium]
MVTEQIKKAVESGITPFAVTTFRNRERIFGIKEDDRRRHVYIIGKTGMGKTTLIENMVYSDIIAGKGVCYVDPHGDTAEKMLSWIPSSRINDVIYFNPSDLHYPISFNVLEKVSSEHRHLVASGLIGVFKKLWADSWGPRLEYILRNAILALLEYPDSTLLGINRMLVDKEYRKKVVAKITDPVVRSFWVDEFPRWNERVLQEVVSPIQNKVGQFLSTSLIRNVVGQVKSAVDLRKVMDENKILILNLSKGRIGEDASALLGAMMVTKIQLAAMSRVDIPEDNRKDFYLYVDEFQNFATDSFADILSEARKYRLNLIIAHQYIEQLGEVVRPAVFGNVGTLMCFRVGAADAEFLEKEFMPYLTQEDLVALPKFHIYLKLMIDGIASEPFSARGLPPVYSDSLGNEQKVINVSRERYAKPKNVVEDKIKRWSGVITEDKKEVEGKGKLISQQSNEQKLKQGEAETTSNEKKKDKGWPAVCSGCKKEIEVPFKPDNVRPVFCKECLKKARRGEIGVKPDEVSKEKTQQQQEAVSLSQISQKTVDFKGKSPEEKKSESAKQSEPQKIQPIKEDKPIGLAKQKTIKETKPVQPTKQEISRPEIQKEIKKTQPVEAEKESVEQEKVLAPEKKESSQQVQEKAEKAEKGSTKEKLPAANLLASAEENNNNVKEGDIIEL